MTQLLAGHSQVHVARTYTRAVGVGKLFVVVALLLAACTKANPNACCTTAEQCRAVDLPKPVSCSAGHVCDPNGACVTPQCSTSADCPASDAPICVGQLCVAKCTVDADCNGLAATPYCATDGTCVACKDDSMCTADKPVCDSMAHSCRGCGSDTECQSGVCLEQQGACPDPGRIVFVDATGFDNGTCTQTSPCQTLSFALQQTSPSRDIVRITGNSLTVPTTNLGFGTLFFDSDSTLISHSGSGATFAVGGGTYTLEGMTFAPNGLNAVVTVSGGNATMFGAKLLGQASVTGGALTIEHSVVNAGLQCAGSARLEIDANTIYGAVSSTGCVAHFAENEFIDPPSEIAVDGAQAVVENNVILAHDSFTDGMLISNNATARFNTFVNVSGTNSGAMALSCNSNAVATSNIIAWHSSMVTCPGVYTLYDEIAGSRPGTGNKTAAVSTFFVDLANKDFHLATNSPAIGGAQPGLPTTTDFDGHSRPNPANSTPDIGAYEAP